MAVVNFAALSHVVQYKYEKNAVDFQMTCRSWSQNDYQQALSVPTSN